MLNEPELTPRRRQHLVRTGPSIVAENENLASGAKLFRNCLLDRNRDRSMTQQANNPTLERLMQAAQTGDARAYECLLSDITPRLRRMIQSQRRFLGPDEIEDILQDVLISMHSVRATYDPQRPFMPWLLAITRNRLADGGRKWARRAANEVLVDEVPVTFADDRTNSEQERQFDPEGLRKAMRDLPHRQRDAVEMLKLREMSLKEAAAESGMSVGSLKVAVHRGIAALRKALVKDQ